MTLALGALLLARACRDEHGTLGSPDHPLVVLADELQAEALPERVVLGPAIPGSFDDALQAVIAEASDAAAVLPEGRVGRTRVLAGEGTEEERAALGALTAAAWRLVEASRSEIGPVDPRTRRLEGGGGLLHDRASRGVLTRVLRALEADLQSAGPDRDAELRPRCPDLFALVRDLERVDPLLLGRWGSRVAAAAAGPCVRVWSDDPQAALTWVDALGAQRMPRRHWLRLALLETLAWGADSLPGGQRQRLPAGLLDLSRRRGEVSVELEELARSRLRREVERTWLDQNLEQLPAYEAAWALPSQAATARALAAIELPEPPSAKAWSMQALLVTGRADSAWSGRAATPWVDAFERGARLPWAMVRAAFGACLGHPAVPDPRTGQPLALDRSTSPPTLAAPGLSKRPRPRSWERARGLEVPCAK